MTTRYDITEGKVLKVIQDNQGCCESPREWDNLCKMIFFGNHRQIGDKHNFKSDDHNGWNDLARAIFEEMDVAVIVSVYGYSHSGLTISTEQFSCPWDSGQLGFAVITKADLRENYGVKRITRKLLEKAMVHPKSEVKTLDQYITGDIYGFQVVDKDDEENIIDSCWGFYGSDITENGILDNLGDEDRNLIQEKLG